MAKIKNVSAIEILDSRGNPTVRTFIELDDDSVGSASVPSGASTGSYEALELRDKNLKRYDGKGVLQAVKNVNKIIKQAIVGKEGDPKNIDRILIEKDGTDDKSNLGANAILSVSLAVCRAVSISSNKPLWKFLNEYFFQDIKVGFPQIMSVVISGGKHADWNFDIQEFLLVPNSRIPSESIRIASEIYHSLGEKLYERKFSTLISDEGSYSPNFSSDEKVFECILNAAKDVGYENIRDFRLSIDVAASEFFKNFRYHLENPQRELNGEELTEYYSKIGQKYLILSFEDAFAEDDWKNHKIFAEMAEKFQFITIGDDLFTTNPERIKRGIEEKAANGVLIKPNQIGTISETVEAIKLAKGAGWKVAVSHRSGETEDTFIADLAYACGADFLKSGAMSRSERLAKYNRLLEIENLEAA